MRAAWFGAVGFEFLKQGFAIYLDSVTRSPTAAPPRGQTCTSTHESAQERVKPCSRSMSPGRKAARWALADVMVS
jgi:hypothetical protein